MMEVTKLCCLCLKVLFAAICCAIPLFITMILGYSISSNLYKAQNQVVINLLSKKSALLHALNESLLQRVPVSTPKTYISFADAYNCSHLWSWRLADRKYFQLSFLLPCRTVSYSGGPKVDAIDSCDYSDKNEFSIENTIKAQRWIFEHQNPINCSNKQFAIIYQYASSGFGSTIHQVVWAFAKALAEDRIAVYASPGDWLYGVCNSSNPDCLFLPISNCTVPSTIDGNNTIRITADFGHWANPIHPPIFQNRTFNWYRAQLLFYVMRYKPETLTFVQNAIVKQLKSTSVEDHRPYIAVFVRRSDKIQYKEMMRAFSLREYINLFIGHAQKANINKLYLNSEDDHVFEEFPKIQKSRKHRFSLLSLDVERNVTYWTIREMPPLHREKIVLDFITDLYIEVNADLHAGTLTSNWCRLVDEIRLVLGKTIPFYTPEHRYLVDM